MFLGSALALVLSAAPGSGVEHLKVTLVKLTASEQKGALTKVVNGQLEPLKGCYDLALKDTPELKGELELELTFEGATLGEAKLSEASPLKDDTLSQCMMARLRTAATWPKMKSGAKATVRLKLAR